MNHWPGYYESREKVLSQTGDHDLELIDMLFGREKLKYGASPQEIKREALRQHEIEWRASE